jgi:hypothetical protein
MRAFLLFGVMALSAGAVVSADQSPAPPQATTKFGALRPAKSPYRQLFQAQTALEAAVAQQVQQAPKSLPKPRVVCGMTMIPGDPSIDPKMLVQPKSDGTKYTIRAIEPPICWSPTP